MEFHLSRAVFALFCLLGSTNALLPAEQYWHSMLPNTPLPAYLRRHIQPGTRHPSRYAYKPDVNVAYAFNYQYIKDADQLVENYDVSNKTVFFLHKDLRPKTKMWPRFYKSILDPSFLPRRIAHSIPFSTTKIPRILNKFSVKSKSIEAAMIKATLLECEAPTMKGEIKHCATSLESLINFNVAKFGRNIEVISTDVSQDCKIQEYTVAAVPKLIGGDAVVSHKLSYPYALFYSHWINDTKVYWLPLVGDDGSRVELATVCHMDTSVWYKEHIAFRTLKVNPGVPICHFPGSDALVWVGSQKSVKIKF